MCENYFFQASKLEVLNKFVVHYKANFKLWKIWQLKFWKLAVHKIDTYTVCIEIEHRQFWNKYSVAMVIVSVYFPVVSRYKVSSLSITELLLLSRNGTTMETR